LRHNARALPGGIKKGQVNSVTNGTTMDDSVESALLDKFEDVLAWDVINCCGLRHNRPRQFVGKLFKEWEIASNPPDIFCIY
jgi:hypothetical protein